MDGHVTLYTRRGCPHCDRVRRALETAGRTYTEIGVDTSPHRISELLKLTKGRRIVPVVVDDRGIQVAPGGGTPF